MFKWIQQRWKSWRAYRKLIHEVDPSNFQKMAGEILELAQVAARVCPPGQELCEQITNIEREMSRLGEMAIRPEFKRLSTGKRLLLRQGLEESKEQLLQAIGTAPATTRTLQ